MSTSNCPTLASALEQHGLTVPSPKLPLINAYCHTLWQWNGKINLTRHTDFETFVARDVVDTVQLSKVVNTGEQVLDVGSGGGVPGLLLAILRDDLEVTLTESTGKKASALRAMIDTLDLPVSVQSCRAEQVLEDFRFDSVVARAVGSLRKVLTWFQPHWDSIGRLLLIKGPRWVEERGEARHRGLMKSLALRRLAHYPMIGTESESVILQITRDRPSS